MTRLVSLGTAAALTLTLAVVSAHAMNKGELTEAMSQTSSLSQSQLVEAVADATGLSEADAKRALEGFISSTEGALKKGDHVQLIGFGSFSVSTRATLHGSVPGTGTKIKAGKKLKNKEAGQDYVSTLAVAGPGMLGIDILIPPGADPRFDLELTIPGDVVAELQGLPDGSKLGEVSLSLVNHDRVPMPPPDGTSPFLYIVLPGSALFADTTGVETSDLRRGFAAASGVAPAAWATYLATGDDGALGDALDLGDDAFASVIFPNAKPTDGCGGTSDDKPESDGTADSELGADADTAANDASDAADSAAPLEERAATLAQMATEIAKSAQIDEATAQIVVDVLTQHGALDSGKQGKKGDKVQLIGFGTFSVSERAARTGRNPQTGKEIKIAARKVVKFKAGKEFSAKVK